MPMAGDGLVKLLEELGELTQIAAKKLAYIGTDSHPDGCGGMVVRMEEEMADVRAASDFVQLRFGLDEEAIAARAKMKFERFERWHNSPD